MAPQREKEVAAFLTRCCNTYGCVYHYPVSLAVVLGLPLHDRTHSEIPGTIELPLPSASSRVSVVARINIYSISNTSDII